MSEPTYDLVILLPLLNDPDYRVQIRAAWTLAVERDPRAIEPMIQMLADEMPYDEDASFNFLLCDALASYSEMAFEPVLRALAPNPQIERDGWRRYWVAKTMGYLGDSRAIPPLVQCLSEDSIQVVVGAGEALLDLADKSAIDPLQKALERYSPSDGYVYTTLSNAIDELEAGVKYRPGDYKTEKLWMRLKKCHGLLEDGTRCTKDARRDSRFCTEHRKGEPRIPMPDLENPIFAGERFIPTSVRKGFRIGDKVHFGELLDGDKFRARGWKIIRQNAVSPLPR